MSFKHISFEMWKQYVKTYVTHYILSHEIYRWIPEQYITWDISGTVEKVTEELMFLQEQEMHPFDEDFLCTLYNGNSIASYVSGHGFFYETYHEAIRDEMFSELYSRFAIMNDINLEEESDLEEELFDYVTDLEEEWIYSILKDFTKEKVIKIVKKKKQNRKW